jgi:hypothetical protein
LKSSGSCKKAKWLVAGALNKGAEGRVLLNALLDAQSHGVSRKSEDLANPVRVTGDRELIPTDELLVKTAGLLCARLQQVGIEGCVLEPKSMGVATHV